MTERRPYHHGDLRRALLEAGTARVRTDGPGAVVLRDVARQCGVTVPAIYRHFADRDDFLRALARLAQRELATRIEARATEVVGEERLRAVGREYIRFALDEPGLFATAFQVPTDLSQALAAEAQGPGGRTPFGLLTAALDEMVDRGEMPTAHRPLAEVAAWSMVHGFSTLATDGPLRSLPREEALVAADLVVEVAIRGIAGR